MLRQPSRLLLFLLSTSPLFLLSACSNCTDVPTVVATMPATITRAGGTNSLDLQGSVTESGTSAEGWNALREFALTDLSNSAGAATWVASGPGFPEDVPLHYVAIQLAGPLHVGDAMEVTAVPGQDLASAWGFAPEGARAFQVSAPGFVTASGSGTLEVLGFHPLRLRMNLHAVSETSEELQVQGEMSVRAGSEEACD